MQTIYLDISNKGVYPCIYAKQGDVNRKFLLVVTDGGVPFDCENTAISVWYDGDSGKGNYTHIGEENAIVVDGNKITVSLIQQMLANSGNGVLSVSVSDASGSQIGLWNIDYCVEKKPGAESEEATNYYDAFSKTAADLAATAKTFTTDKTLSKVGLPADAAETGKKFVSVQSSVAEQKLEIAVERSRIDNFTAMRSSGGVTVYEIPEKDGISGTITSNGIVAYVYIEASGDFANGDYTSFDLPEYLAPFGEFKVLPEDAHFTVRVRNVSPPNLLVSHTATTHGTSFAYAHYPLASGNIAEVEDVRVSYDGTTIYPTAGDSVRGQVGDIESAFNIENVIGNNILDPNNSSLGRFSESPEVGKKLAILYPDTETNRLVSKDPIPVPRDTEFLYLRTSLEEDDTTSGIYIYFLDENECYIKKYNNSFKNIIAADNNSLKTDSVPSDCAFIHVMVTGAKSGHDFSKVCISCNPIDSFEEYAFTKKRTLKPSAMPEKVAPTHGMKMLVFGDSNTETANMDADGGNYNPNYRYNFPLLVHEMLQADGLRNLARHGATLRDTGYERNEYGILVPKDDSVVPRMNLSEQIDLALAMNAQDGYIPDIIIVSIGGNDSEAIVKRPEESQDTYAEAMSIESLEDFTYEARTKMHTALRYAMWSLRDAYPDAKCFMATPLQRTAFECPQYTIDTIIKMAGRYNFKVVDTHNESGIIRETCYPPKWFDKYADDDPAGLDSQYDLYDGLHTSKRGARKLASLYADVILGTYLHDEYVTKEATE